MELALTNDTLYKRLQRLQSMAQNAMHRSLVVLSGEQQWVIQRLAHQLSLLAPAETLIVGNNELPIEGTLTTASKLKPLLGTEVECIIWDGFSGINPDGFGAASGLLKAGGLFFLLLPDLNFLSRNPDNDYLRMCSSEDELSLCGTRFIKRLIKLIHLDEHIFLIEQDKPSRLIIENSSPKQAPCSLPTQDQLKLIDAIISVAKGHLKRPLVVLADRGRGKSSALGIAAAQLVKQHKFKVLITAPSARACGAAFDHFSSEYPELGLDDSLQLEFIPPDELIERTPNCHLLLVDEAAAIPSPMLKKMLQLYPRIVFSSTVHGYEGNGQGFSVRFRKELDLYTPDWKSIYLKQAIRWAPNDPLENFTFQFLLLNAEIKNEVFQTDTLKPSIRWASQDELSLNENLLSQIISLLVLAHYQTSPSDIRLILDHPRIHIAICEGDAEQKNILLGVLLIIEEGGINDIQLAQAIFEGHRRPRGHLVPQALVSYTGLSESLTQRTFRVMRIAVHPKYTNKGFGSELLNAAREYAIANQIDSLSTSFGITPALMNFWQMNAFQTVKVGTHKDGASGTQSVILFQALSNKAQQTAIKLTKYFITDFLYGLPRHHKYLAANNVLAILESVPLDQNPLSLTELHQLNAYAEFFRSFEDSLYVISKFILNCFENGSSKVLDNQSLRLIVMRIFQGKELKYCVEVLQLNGKKEVAKLLKDSTLNLLNNNISNNKKV